VKARPPLPDGPYLVLGLGRSGVAAALALRARGAEVTCVDRDGGADTTAVREAGARVHVGGEPIELLEQAAVLVKSPGVSSDRALLVAARERGNPVLGELELAWRLIGNEFIAVTGTNGKTTTVELIAHIHRQGALPVAVAGNVGTAASSLVGALAPEVTVVCEASSFQLEDSICFAPEAAVLLNVTPDHLDRHGTMDAYLEAKLAIFARQDSNDVAVAPVELISSLGPRMGGGRVVEFGPGSREGVEERDGVICWGDDPLVAAGELRVPGAHNVQNAMAAAAVCLARGIDSHLVAEGLRTFPGVPHRLEEVAHHDGVSYVNDSKATNVASTLVALQALCGGGAPIIHLILGGQGKGQDFEALGEIVGRCARAVYLIGEDGPAIGRALKGLPPGVHDCGTLEEAIKAARQAAAPGEIVLLSPAAASFDQFRDFEARGERFRELAEFGGTSTQVSK